MQNVSRPIPMIFARLVKASQFPIRFFVFQQRMLLGVLMLLALSPGCQTNTSTGVSWALKQSRTSLVLAQEGKAHLPIVISPGASAEIRAVATEMAEYLQRITGAQFAVQT